MAEISLPNTDYDVRSIDRNGAHTHIKGLGLDERYTVVQGSDEIVGQEKARRAVGLFLKMVTEGIVAGRSLLLAGPPGSGKTALALALAKSLPDKDTPFVTITGSDLHSLEMNRSEALRQAMRKAMGLWIKEEIQVIEGEIVEIEIDRPGADGKGTKTGKMTLRTTDMETLYDLGPKMILQLQKKNITAGDVVTIEKVSGILTKLGRSFTKAAEFDAAVGTTKFVSIPAGEAQKLQEVVHRVTFHDVDVVNSRSQGYLSLFAGLIGEIGEDIRDSVDRKVKEMSVEDRAKIVPGVLFIDECHMLDIETFAFMNRAMESEYAPIIVLATNRGVTEVRGSGGYKSAHGIPMDFLDRTVIVHTNTYTDKEIRKIIRLRADSEGFTDILEDGALALLSETAVRSSLRYSLNILNIAGTCRELRQSKTMGMEDVERALRLFVDAKTSYEMLLKVGHQYLFHTDE